MRFDEGKIVIDIELGNAAMCSPVEVGQLLRDVADEIAKLQEFPYDDGGFDAGQVRRKFRDVNGNTVALWKHEPW